MHKRQLPHHFKASEQHDVRSHGWRLASEHIPKGKEKTKNRMSMNIEQIIKKGQGTIVDVRTPGEFRSGSVKGSINIPLQELQQRMSEVRRLTPPLVLCCASGGRSGQVHSYLSQQGVECVNAGSWLEVDYIQSQIA
jgi:phage shock protein E